MALQRTHNPDGSVTETTIPDAETATGALYGSYKGVIRAKAKALIKAGKHSEAITLLKKIGE